MALNCYLITSKGLGVLSAHVGEHVVVLDGIIALAHDGVELLNGGLVAVHVLDVGSALVEARLGGEGGEVGVDSLAVSNLLLVGLLVLSQTSGLSHVVEVLQLVIAGIPLGEGHQVLDLLLLLRVSNELTNHVVDERLVTIAADVGLGHTGDEAVELLVQGLSLLLTLIGILHPEHGELVTQAGTEVLALDDSLISAIPTPRGLVVVGSSDGEHVQILREVQEHGSRVAGLNVEDELVVHLLLVHLLDGSEQISRVEVTLRQAEHIWATVVGEEQEHVILLSGLEHLLTSGLVTSQNLDQSLGRNLLLLVIDNDTLVHIGHVITGVVVKLTRERIFLSERNIVVHQGNDVVGLNSTLLHNLISVSNISVVAVVPHTLGTANQDSPVRSGSQSQNK